MSRVAFGKLGDADLYRSIFAGGWIQISTTAVAAAVGSAQRYHDGEFRRRGDCNSAAAFRPLASAETDANRFCVQEWSVLCTELVRYALRRRYWQPADRTSRSSQLNRVFSLPH
jgi:hypothetical protein